MEFLLRDKLKETRTNLYVSLYDQTSWPSPLAHFCTKAAFTQQSSSATAGSRLLPAAIQHNILRKRRRSRPLRPRLLFSPPVQVPHQRQRRELQQRREHPSQRENHNISSNQRNDQIRPVRHARAVASDAHPRSPRPHDEPVGQVDGEDHGVEEDEEAHREEGLHPRGQLDGDLQADGEEQDREGGILVAGVDGAAFGGHDGFARELVGVDAVFGGVEGPFAVEDAEQGCAERAGERAD
jgi:hypothetical protein